ncbi:hypothetical protein WOLCODRAFT_18969 [Wolfiporia cocos MD-104 SS10]|uniref:Uncharacterized protein n=1 Tax=Wolfiporia cocos (strain MD-104) TaxID=742152 RepID=A0A2H3JQR5_WOLCO|nr:hypothetical protein WOLCODRAFT_18969 [Wolfiporia cocos MD-104 SS10]
MLTPATAISVKDNGNNRNEMVDVGVDRLHNDRLEELGRRRSTRAPYLRSRDMNGQDETRCLRLVLKLKTLPEFTIQDRAVTTAIHGVQGGRHGASQLTPPNGCVAAAQSIRVVLKVNATEAEGWPVGG